MNIELAIRITEILLGFALTQQSLEHLIHDKDERTIFTIKLALALLLISGLYSEWIVILLLVISLLILYRFDGPYNGGADRMRLLILFSINLYHLSPSLYWKEIAFGYLAMQLILSYFISGWVKIINPQWRNGQALIDVFKFSAYPVSESLRKWSKFPKLLLFMSWSVILFELAFPLSMLSTISLIIALLFAVCFHLANAFLFGLNRFFWTWIAAYPAILWFQHRLFFINI